MERQFSAGLILYRINKKEEREYLLLHYESGHWDFPKGKIEQGETKHQAALRELAEETALTAEILPGFEEQFTYWFRDRKGNLIQKTVFFFIAETEGDQSVVLSHEHIGYEWLPFTPAVQKVTFENARIVLTKANTYLNKF